MAGRPRKPTRLKVIHGTDRPDRTPANEPQPDEVLELPNPPSIMPRAGKKMWKVLGEELMDKGLLTEVDLQTFEICCFNYGLYRAAADSVFCMIDNPNKPGSRRRRKLAEYLEGRNSQTMPEYSAMTKAFATFKSYLVEFGLSPAARSRIDLGELDDDDEEIEAMKRLLNES